MIQNLQNTAKAVLTGKFIAIQSYFKKTGDINGIFHVRMGMKKDRNGKNLTGAKEIKKRWQDSKD